MWHVGGEKKNQFTSCYSVKLKMEKCFKEEGGEKEGKIENYNDCKV